MKLLFLSDNFFPEVNAPATRTLEHAVEWVKMGHQVTVITCAPNFPIGKVYDGYRNRWRSEEWIEGIRVIRVWSYIAENRGFVKRILDYLSYAFTASIAGFRERPDLIVATSPQFFTTLAGAFLARRHRRPWIFELRDLWPDSIKTVGAMRDGFLIRSLERLELWLYRDADRIVPVTNAFKQNLISRGIDGDKQLVVPNGCNTALFYPRPPDAELLETLQLQEKFLLGYIGTHGMAHSLEFIVESMEELQNSGDPLDQKLHLLLIGAGARKEAAMALAQKLELRNVTFLDPIPKEEVPRYLSICAVSLAPLIRKETFKTVIPSKIFEAAAMGIPTLLGVEGQAQEIVESYGTGLCFLPEDRDSFLTSLRQLQRDSELRRQIIQNTSALVRDYDRVGLAQKMEKLFLELVAEGRKKR